MRYVGFYREQFYGDAVDGARRDVEQALPDPEQDAILLYLKMGAVVMTAHFCWDVPEAFDQSDKYANWIYTDGRWVWPGNLADNVKRYHVKLPGDFLATMQANNWEVPRLRDIGEMIREDKRRAFGGDH